jgi:hypothetical protein
MHIPGFDSLLSERPLRHGEIQDKLPTQVDKDREALNPTGTHDACNLMACRETV